MNPYEPPDDESQLDRIERRFELHHGDCLEVLATLPDCSVDAIVTDPPYGLSFMGKRWDYDVPSVDIWTECLRVLKPGGHLLAFAGTRTQHRMAVRIEDAGFEIRDMIAWVYGSGFPKSADVSKRIDLEERKQWLDVSKAIDNLDVLSIMEAWKKHLKIASDAELSFARNQIETGTNTLKSGFALGRVLIQADPESSDALALLAELSSREALLTLNPEKTSALTFADASEPQSLAKHAENSQKRETAKFTIIGIALCDAKESPSASMASRLKGVEALRIWLGSNASSRLAATNALCAALTEDLRRIILSQSKIFQSLDTTRQTGCASAITVTITESTAESLILFTAGILKSKSIDKAAGAEREVVGTAFRSNAPGTVTNKVEWVRDVEYPITAPATEAAKQWEGLGTAIKPALEPITLARKPLIGTVAANVLEHGTGGLNIGACRVGTEGGTRRDGKASEPNDAGWENMRGHGIAELNAGRWPANFIHDGSEEVTALFPDGRPSGGSTLRSSSRQSEYGMSNCEREVYLDIGSAARFFYCAKASKADRDEGLPMGQHSSHPTVKPTDLMRYLCRLITPPGGIVLDPFAGSGSTGKAAILEDFKFIGIEREAEYIEIARARIDAAIKFRSEFLF